MRRSPINARFFCKQAGLESGGVAGLPAEMGAGHGVKRRARGGRGFFPTKEEKRGNLSAESPCGIATATRHGNEKGCFRRLKDANRIGTRTAPLLAKCHRCSFGLMVCLGAMSLLIVGSPRKSSVFRRFMPRGMEKADLEWTLVRHRPPTTSSASSDLEPGCDDPSEGAASAPSKGPYKAASNLPTPTETRVEVRTGRNRLPTSHPHNQQKSPGRLAPSPTGC